MHAEALVSVIIPARDAAAVIGDALESVHAQQYTNLQVIVVDDGSTDETAEIVRAFSREDPRLRLVRQERTGVSAARNAGLREATGKWIAFLDADDVWFPDKLAAQLVSADATLGANFLFSNYTFWDGQRELGTRYAKRKQFPHGDVRKKLARWNVFGTSSVVVSRSLVDAAGAFDASLSCGEDWDLWLRMAECGMRARGIRRPLLRYRVWDGNMSRDALANAECDLRLLEKAVMRCNERGWRSRYLRSTRKARGKLELARLRADREPSPDALRATLWSAWRAYPRHLKWLLWCGLAWGPARLGGRWWRTRSHSAIDR